MHSERKPITRNWVDVLGARVHYLHAGAGRPLLLIHGVAGSSSTWSRSIPELARHMSVYAIDLINMGKSERIAGLDAGLEATADRVAAAMDALGLDSADIVGHSHGGAVAWMLAARHPRRVKSLILFAPANPYSDLGDALVKIYNTWPGNLAVRMAPYLPIRIQRNALARMYGDPSRIPDGSVEAYVTGLKVPGTTRHIRSIIRDWFAEMEKLSAALTLVADIPTLLVWGDRDRAVDLESANELRQILPQSKVCVVPSGGHIVFEELPDESNRIMIEWLNSGTVSAAPAQMYRGATNESRTAPDSASLPATQSSLGKSDPLPRSTPVASAPAPAPTLRPESRVGRTDRGRR